VRVDERQEERLEAAGLHRAGDRLRYVDAGVELGRIHRRGLRVERHRDGAIELRYELGLQLRLGLCGREPADVDAVHRDARGDVAPDHQAADHADREQRDYADDDQLVEMASLSKGHVMYFSANAAAPVLASHATAGGRAVVLSEGVIRLLEGELEIAQLRAGTLELPIEGDPRSADDGLLAAIAAAWAIGIPPERIQAGLETLEPMPAPQVAA
jgi:hypothetical protein